MARLSVFLLALFAFWFVWTASCSKLSSLDHVSIFGEELAPLLTPGGLEDYVDSKIKHVQREFALETMGYHVRSKRGRVKRETTEDYSAESSVSSQITTATVDPLDLGTGYDCQLGSISVVQVDNATAFVVAGCVGENKGALFRLHLESSRIQFLKTFELLREPSIICTYLWGGEVLIVFGSQHEYSTVLYTFQVDAQEIEVTYRQTISGYGKPTSCVIFVNAWTLSMATTYGEKALGDRGVSYAVDSAIHDWRSVYFDQRTQRIPTVAAKHVHFFRYRDDSFLSITQSTGEDGDPKRGKIVIYRVTTAGSLELFTDLPVESPVASHAFETSNSYLILLVACRDGRALVYVWMGELMIDLHGISTGGLVNFGMSWSWTHFTTGDHTTIGTLITNGGIYFLVQRSTGLFEVYHKLILNGPEYVDVYNVDSLVHESKIYFALSGTSATSDRAGLLYQTSIPQPLASESMKEEQNELDQCLLNLGKMLKEKLPVLEEIQSKLHTCLPLNGPSTLDTPYKVVVHGDVIVNGVLSAGTVEHLSDDHEQTLTMDTLDAKLKVFEADVANLTQSVERLSIALPKIDPDHQTTYTINKMTISLGQAKSPDCNVSGLDIGRLMDTCLRKSEQQTLPGTLDVMECYIGSLDLQGTLNKNKYTDFLLTKSTEQPQIVTGTYEITGNVIIKNDAHLSNSSKINGIDPDDLCHKDHLTELTGNNYFENLHLERLDVESDMVNGKEFTKWAKNVWTSSRPLKAYGDYVFEHVHVESGNIEVGTVNNYSQDDLQNIALLEDHVKLEGDIQFNGRVYVNKSTEVTGSFETDTPKDSALFTGDLTITGDLHIDGNLHTKSLNNVPCSKLVTKHTEQVITECVAVNNVEIGSMTLDSGKKIDGVDLEAERLPVSGPLVENCVFDKDVEVGSLIVEGPAYIDHFNGLNLAKELQKCVNRSRDDQVISNVNADKVIFNKPVSPEKLNDVEMKEYWRIGPSHPPQIVTAPMNFLAPVTAMSIDVPEGRTVGGCNWADLKKRVVRTDMNNVEINGNKEFEKVIVKGNFDAKYLNDRPCEDLFGTKRMILNGTTLETDELVIMGNVTVSGPSYADLVNDVNATDCMRKAVYVDQDAEILTSVHFSSIEANDIYVNQIESMDVSDILQHGLDCDLNQNIKPVLIVDGLAKFNGHLFCECLNGVCGLTNHLKFKVVNKDQPGLIAGKKSFARIVSFGDVQTPKINRINIKATLENSLSKSKDQDINCEAYFEKPVQMETLNFVELNGHKEDTLFYHDSYISYDGPIVFENRVVADCPIAQFNGSIIGDNSRCTFQEVHNRLKSQMESEDPGRIAKITSARSIYVTGDCNFEAPVNNYEMNDFLNHLVQDDAPATVEAPVSFEGGLKVEDLRCETINNINIDRVFGNAWTPKKESQTVNGHLSMLNHIEVNKLIIEGNVEPGSRMNGENLKDLMSKFATDTEELQHVHPNTNFEEGLTCDKVFINRNLNGILVSDIYRVGDNRVIPGNTTITQPAEFGNLTAEVINGKSFRAFLDDRLTNTGKQTIHYDLPLGDNVRIETLCMAPPLNDILDLKDIVKASDPGPVELTGTKEVTGNAVAEAETAIENINGVPFQEYLQDFFTKRQHDKRALGDMSIPGEVNTGPDLRVDVKDSLNGQDVNTWKAKLEKYPVNAAEQSAALAKAISNLKENLEGKVSEIFALTGRGTLSFFEDHQLVPKLGRIRKLDILEIPGKDPLLSGHLETPCPDKEFCLCHDTILFHVNSEGMLTPSENKVGRYYHLSGGQAEKAYMVWTNVNSDLRRNYPARCPSRDPSMVTLETLSLSGYGSNSGPDSLKANMTIQELSLDFVGDVKSVLWNGVRYLFVGSLYNLETDSSRSVLHIFRFNDNTEVFELMEQKIPTYGLASIAVLTTDDYLHLALCNSDSENKTSVDSSAIYSLQAGESEFRLLRSVATQHCSSVAAATVDDTSAFVFAQRKVTADEQDSLTAAVTNQYTVAPVVLLLGNAAEENEAAIYNYFVDSYLEGDFGVTDMDVFYFNDRAYLVTVSPVKDTCIIYQWKGCQAFAEIQRIPVNKPSGVQSYVVGEDVYLAVGTNTGVKVYKAHLIRGY